jgi:hypothetical protein
MIAISSIMIGKATYIAMFSLLLALLERWFVLVILVLGFVLRVGMVVEFLFTFVGELFLLGVWDFGLALNIVDLRLFGFFLHFSK